MPETLQDDEKQDFEDINLEIVPQVSGIE